VRVYWVGYFTVSISEPSNRADLHVFPPTLLVGATEGQLHARSIVPMSAVCRVDGSSVPGIRLRRLL